MRHVALHALFLLLFASLAGLSTQDVGAQISVDAAVHTTASYHHFTPGRTLGTSAEVGGANWNHAWQRVRRGVVHVEFPRRSAFRLRLGLGRQLDDVVDDNTVAVLGIVLRLR